MSTLVMDKALSEKALSKSAVFVSSAKTKSVCWQTSALIRTSETLDAAAVIAEIQASGKYKGCTPIYHRSPDTTDGCVYVTFEPLDERRHQDKITLDLR